MPSRQGGAGKPHPPSNVLPPGAYAILATPFSRDERLDVDSLGRLVAFYRERGVKGVVALAVMGEAAKLSDDERGQVLRAVFAAAGDLPVVVGVSAPGMAVVRQRLQRAGEMGAVAALLAPSAGMDAAAVEGLYRGAAEVGLPLVLQDHPASTGVVMPAALVARICGELERVVAIKNEAPPTAPKAADELAALSGRPLTLLGGLGGLSLLDELDAGAHGTMTGFAFPEMLARVVARHRAGERQAARALYEAALPWLVFEATPSVSLGIRKEFLRLRGVLPEARVRQPAAPLKESLARRAAELAAAFPGLAERFSL